MKTLLWPVIAAFALVAAPAHGQEKSADVNMQILRDKLKADKKLVVAANMQLTDREATAFWPIYDAYQKDLQAINLRMGNAILAYTDAYGTKSLNDDMAKKLLDEAVAIEESEAKLRKEYVAKLVPALPATKAVRYLQIENKIRAAVRYEIAANIPLVE